MTPDVIARYTDGKNRTFTLVGNPADIRRQIESSWMGGIEDPDREEIGINYVNGCNAGDNMHYYDGGVTPEIRRSDEYNLLAAVAESVDWEELLCKRPIKQNGTLYKNRVEVLACGMSFGCYWMDSYGWGGVPTIRIQNIDDFTAQLQFITEVVKH